MRDPLIFVDDLVGWPGRSDVCSSGFTNATPPLLARVNIFESRAWRSAPVPIYLYTRHTTSSLWRSRQLNVAGEGGMRRR